MEAKRTAMETLAKSSKMQGYDINHGTNVVPASILAHWLFGGPGRDRTDDLFHAMEARSQLRHRPTFRRGKTLIIFDE
jgi:hypothetical protein